MISAKVIADSKSEQGHRITTMVVTMPRFILAEFNTHRMFSRNSASSRAIPFEKMVKSVDENPFIPIAWQRDHKGMQGTEYLTAPIDLAMANDIWVYAKNDAVKRAKHLHADGTDNIPFVTKQLCNRLLEPFIWHKVLITATEFENFFALRCPFYRIVGNDTDSYNPDFDYRSRKQLEAHLGAPDVVTAARRNGINEELAWLSLNKGQAEIHMMALAEAMWDAYNESVPKELKAGEWHIPFGDDIDGNLLWETFKDHKVTGNKGFAIEYGIRIATARCARISYTTVGEEDKIPNYANDIKLHDRLLALGHMSPFEHCAKAMTYDEYKTHIQSGPKYEDPYGGESVVSLGWSGNFRGFVQYRKMIPNENIHQHGRN